MDFEYDGRDVKAEISIFSVEWEKDGTTISPYSYPGLKPKENIWRFCR